MLSRRAAATLARQSRSLRATPQASRATFSTSTVFKADTNNNEVDDPGMNGGYINPPAIKRQFRDPYGDWTDKQQRRNFGEPLHEDEDTLNLFSLEQYTHMSSGMGLVMWGFFLSCVGAVSFGVYSTYPDRPSVPKAYPGGLDKELGGAGALRAYQKGDEFEGSNL